jgi:hypothetical protein
MERLTGPPRFTSPTHLDMWLRFTLKIQFPGNNTPGASSRVNLKTLKIVTGVQGKCDDFLKYEGADNDTFECP